MVLIHQIGVRFPVGLPIMTDKHTPTILIILGITGDLTAKKIAPALFNLYLKNALPEKFRIVGFGRKPFDDKSIQSFVSEMIRAKIQNADLKRVEEFSKLFSYQHGLFESKESYEALKELLDKILTFNRTFQREFLKAFFDDEGSIYFQKKRNLHFLEKKR